MPWALQVKRSGLPTQDPYTQLIHHLLWFYFLTDSEFSCLAMLAKQYPLSSPTPMPQIPNQLHCIQKSAHEVFGTILRT